MKPTLNEQIFIWEHCKLLRHAVCFSVSICLYIHQGCQHLHSSSLFLSLCTNKCCSITSSQSLPINNNHTAIHWNVHALRSTLKAGGSYKACMRRHLLHHHWRCRHTVNSTLQYSERSLTVVHSHIEACITKCYTAVTSTIMLVKGHSISLILGSLYHWQ